MSAVVNAGQKTGVVTAPSSKSQAHRLLICAALGARPVTVHVRGLSRDILATAECLRSLGAGVAMGDGGEIRVTPLRSVPTGLRRLPCGESGSTLRFLIPVAGALGAAAVFHREGRLSRRPLAPLDEELTAHGMTIREDGDDLFCEGRLLPGAFTLPGNVSSQYISGLLLALPLLDGDSSLTVTGPVESAPYLRITEAALEAAGIRLKRENNAYAVSGRQSYGLPEAVTVEGDYSSAAFFLCLGALSDDGVTVTGLNPDSPQGDRAVVDVLRRFGADVRAAGGSVTVRKGTLRGLTLDAAQIPDLIPALCAVAAVSEGETRVINGSRLRLKESDRIESTAAMLRALGGDVTETEDGMVIRGRPVLSGGTVDPRGDHRIAMAAAVAASACRERVVVERETCVEKSYPDFWNDLSRLTEKGTES